MFAFFVVGNGHMMHRASISCEMHLLFKCLCCVDIIVLTYVYVCLLCEEKDCKMYDYKDLLIFQDLEL